MGLVPFPDAGGRRGFGRRFAGGFALRDAPGFSFGRRGFGRRFAGGFAPGFGPGHGLFLFLVVGFQGENHTNQLRVQLQEHGQGHGVGGDAVGDDGIQQLPGAGPEYQVFLLVQAPKDGTYRYGIIEQRGDGDGELGKAGSPRPPGGRRFRFHFTPFLGNAASVLLIALPAYPTVIPACAGIPNGTTL